MKNITFLLPLKEPDYSKVNNLLDSLPTKSKVIIGGVYDKKKIKSSNVTKTFMLFDGLLSDCLNQMIKKVKTTHLSIIAYDDLISDKYSKIVDEYMQETDYDVYLPIVVQYNSINQPVGYINQTMWAKEFTKEQGFLDFDSLKKFGNYLLYGAVIKTSLFESLGYFKVNLDPFYEYEFLLRCTHNNKDVFGIPKILYTHIAREDNRLQQLKKQYTPIQLSNMKKQSAKESYFKIERELIGTTETINA